MAIFDKKLRDDQDVGGFTAPKAPEPSKPAGRSAYEVGKGIHDSVAGGIDTANYAAARSNLVRSQGISQLAAPAREFVVGLFGGNTPPTQPNNLPEMMPPSRSREQAPAGTGTRPPASPAASLSPIASAQAAPTPPVQAPAPQIITPSDPASMAVQPPSGGRAAAPAAAAAASPVVGQFNGRDFTREQVDALAGRLPVAGGPVAVGPGGSFAFAPPAAPGSLQQAAAVAAPQAPQQTPLEVPRFQPPSVDTRRVAAAEQERAKLVGQLDDQIRRMAMSPAGLNSRGERQLYAQLLAQRTGLTQQAGDLAGRAAGDQVSAATTAGVAGMGQQGENARTLLREAGSTDRTLLSEAGANARAAFTPPQYQTDANGNVVLTSGAQFQPVTGPDGKPLQAPRTKAEGAITPQVQLETLVKQLQAEQSSLQPDPTRVAALTQQIGAFMPGAQAAGGGAPPQAAIAHLRANPNLAAQFDAKYGEGASSRYLSR